MKRIIVITSLIVFSFNLSAQDDQTEKIESISNEIKNLDKKIQEIDKKSKSLNYKFEKYNKQNTKEFEQINSALIDIDSITNNLSNELNSNGLAIKNNTDSIASFKTKVAVKLEDLRRNFLFDLLLEGTILMLIILTISFLLFQFSRKNRKDLIELKREVDFEIRIAEQEAKSEIRGIKEEMKKYKTPDALKHGPAFISLRDEFVKEIHDAKEIFITRINELSEKYEKESSYTKERMDKDVIDFKHQIQKEIDDILERIEGDENEDDTKDNS